MSPTILFTHLKIILLQYFQFSVFSNNKFNPNTPLIPTGLLKLQSNLGHNKSYVSTQLTQSNSPVWSIAAVLTDTKELIYCLSTHKKGTY